MFVKPPGFMEPSQEERPPKPTLGADSQDQDPLPDEPPLVTQGPLQPAEKVQPTVTSPVSVGGLTDLSKGPRYSGPEATLEPERQPSTFQPSHKATRPEVVPNTPCRFEAIVAERAKLRRAAATRKIKPAVLLFGDDEPSQNCGDDVRLPGREGGIKTET